MLFFLFCNYQDERIVFDYLSAHKFDKALKEDVQDNRYSTYYNGISALNKIFPWIGDLSKKLSRNISFVHDSYIPGDEFNKKRCYDLNFWLHDQVYKNLQSSKKSTEYLGGIVDKLQSVWQDIVDKEFQGRVFTCLPDKKLLLNMQFLQEIKDLFDFFQDYSEIKGEIIAKPLEACLKYVDYLRQKLPIYYTWRDSCVKEEYTCKRYIDDYMR
ncbi:hypothetical protein PVX_090320 [Plasmodium vivax]|uniref:Vir protein n=1 Tax=Plasmodium vivax (strain Salvador I) TaxID=126793 RepID=A5K694_PLAVS|nr:hypothetical protein PVX_090320 [Plasmodium vivax]EDL45429.1 hypothetical protein PVX_090320 [Plasmodium vivax]|eukprot:XP_001615156.1 hypothetical protein [Plasmodium vivax Sal-1]